MKQCIPVFAVVATIIGAATSARILGIIPTASYSHQVGFQPIWKELSLRGHQVTVLTSHPINDPTLTNLSEIDTSFSINILTDTISTIINNRVNVLKALDLSMKTFCDVFEKQMEHPKAQLLLHDPNIKFDLLIVEYMLSVPLAFSRHFNCAFIGVLSFEGTDSSHRTMGNPSHPVVYPNVFLGEYGQLSLTKRVTAVFFDVIYELYTNWVNIPYQQKLSRKLFGQHYDLQEIKQSASLLFINSDPVLNAIRPLNPTVIQIGGRPLRLPSKPLPTELQALLDNARSGFIYFSLGSNIKIRDISQKKLDVLLDTFKELPFVVLWKYEQDELLNKPDNVVISKWLPQVAILGHSNIKLFITHGGIQSVEESISAGVPMLGMPFFVDQPYNVQKMVNLGCALSIDYKKLKKEHFKTAILELIHNPMYRKKIKQLRDLAEDQPMTGLERAVWWTEYVLRHNGTRHLRSPILDVPWYQSYLLDVAVVFVTVVSAFIYALVRVVKIIFKLFKWRTGSYAKVKGQ